MEELENRVVTREGQIEEQNHWNFPGFTNCQEDIPIENKGDHRQASWIGPYKEIILQDIYIWHGQFRSPSEAPLPICIKRPFIQLLFCLGGSITFRNSARQPLFANFAYHQQNTVLVPEGNIFVDCPRDVDHEVFALHLSPELFFRILSESHFLQKQFHEAIRKGVPSILSKGHMPLSPRMLAVLFEILHYDYGGPEKGIYIKAKVLELIVLQMTQYEQLPSPQTVDTLQDADLLKMQHARDILIKNLESTVSLKELARQVGTNEFNLKKKFKIQYGETVFGYLHKYRMEKARELLCLEENKIADVAQRVGYKHATHFTAAFKKYFGYVPNKIRISLLYLLESMTPVWECITDAFIPLPYL
ncbi:helix-turn-helix transcriptional regulator [Dyadobacter tibetensis]|uniref:helix-turn-helix transcriptional regulator n=1 Tax=Dyadobacter tibetensis TaxID=1211851 RepID=UPI00046E92F5|nr:AraC family transcriptional regulator [Dyadobacter tibetensis]